MLNVSFGYSDSDDRMWIRIGDGPMLWWVTRRLAMRIIEQWAALVERTAPAAEGSDELPAEETARRTRWAQSEHRAALVSAGPSVVGTIEEPPPRPGKSALMFGAEIAVDGDLMRIVFRSGRHRQTFETPRRDAHRLLAAFIGRCRRNGWLDAPLPEWLR